MLYHTGYWFREYTTEQFFSRYPAMGDRDHPLLLESKCSSENTPYTSGRMQQYEEEYKYNTMRVMTYR